MIKTSKKKIFSYLSLAFIIGYFVVVLLAYNSGVWQELYTLDVCGFYYITVYLLVVAVAYYLDTSSRKEPGYLTLFSLPAYSGIFLLSAMMMAGVDWQHFVILILSISLLYILGYFCNKKWIEKLLLVKNGYENILMIYLIFHLIIVLYIAFKLLGLL